MTNDLTLDDRCRTIRVGKKIGARADGGHMNRGPSTWQPAQLGNLCAELSQDPALAEQILRVLPPAPWEPQERVIRCSRGNAERAICRAFALAAVLGEIWGVEIQGESDV